MIVWDRGTWSPARPGDPAGAIAAGELHFDLHGEKLRGRFLLIRRDKDRSGKEQWLLLHKKDDFAEPGWSPEDHPHSVKTGRTNDEVAPIPTLRCGTAAAPRPGIAGGRRRRRLPAPTRGAERPRPAGQGGDVGA